MQTVIVIILAISAIFFVWFGIVVESGLHRPDPFDSFFTLPVRGFNVDYMMGVAGLSVGVGLIFLAAALFFNQNWLALLGAVFFILGIIRSLIPPHIAGPHWFHKTKKSPNTKRSNL